MKERNDEWSRLRREWRDAADDYMVKVMVPGWDDVRKRESMARIARLSVRLRIFEQGRRSMGRAAPKREK